MVLFESDREDLESYGELYGGRGEIWFKDFFLGASNLPIRFQSWTIPVGGSEGEHDHEGEENLEEIYYVLEGEARFEALGKSTTITPGSAVMVSPNERHAIFNTGRVPLRMIVIYGKATGPHVPV